MIRFFRIIRQRLLNDGKFSKYFLYAVGEIFLVVIGILVAVGIGEWRQDIKTENELQGYYQGIKNDIHQDKIRISTFDSLYKTAERGIVNEIDKMQRECPAVHFALQTFPIQPGRTIPCLCFSNLEPLSLAG